jgi:peptidoglycan/xylan/chitin deacetylase (PgdA/CDA1 family)
VRATLCSAATTTSANSGKIRRFLSHTIRSADSDDMKGRDAVRPDSPDGIAAQGDLRMRLIETAERFGLARALRPLHDRRRASLTVLAYHRVMPAGAPDSYPFDLELISATPAQFERQIEYVRRHMNPVSLRQVVAHLENATPLPRAAVAVTFDDGFWDTYRHAFPILQRHAVPATVFVTTGYVDSGEPFWFELAAFLTLRVDPGALEIEDCGQVFPAGGSMRERRESLKILQEVLKGLPNARRTAIIAGWVRRFAKHIETGAVEPSRPLSWEQVCEMSAAGIDFGSHSVTHPNLTQLADADLRWELTESKRVLEGRLDRPIATLAYPIGTASAFDARVIAAAESAGFRLAATYLSGVNWVDKLDRFELRRHGVGLATTPAYFRALLSLPSWLG